MVGYPRTANRSPSSVSSVASILARRISEFSSFKALAALTYSGARALQCPHHGASEEISKLNKTWNIRLILIDHEFLTWYILSF